MANKEIHSFRTVIGRALMFGADLLMWLVMLALGVFILDLTIGLNLGTRPNLAWFLMERYESWQYLVPVVGIGYLYNRSRARRFDPEQTTVLHAPFLDSQLFARASIALAVAAALATALTGAVMAAVGFFAGVMVASGAGAALKGRIVGLVHEKTQLLVAMISALAILGGSWLAGWASLSVAGTSVHGGYVAPALGLLVGLFLNFEDKQERPLTPDAGSQPSV